jgi:OmpA family
MIGCLAHQKWGEIGLAQGQHAIVIRRFRRILRRTRNNHSTFPRYARRSGFPTARCGGAVTSIWELGVDNNQQLSLKRAQTVRNFLISQGVNPTLVSERGLGEADPVAPNDTLQARAQNRRVELTLAGPGT